jgi:hypothetical protein
VSKWIFVSKGKKDPYINSFRDGAGANGILVDSDTFRYKDYEASDSPIVLRGILKKRIIHQCLNDNRTFYYMDTGYFGNEMGPGNPHGWKFWHRVVKNDLQHGDIITRPDDRFLRFKKTFSPWKKDGRKIILAAPDEKPMKFYDLDLDTWIEDTVNEIKKHTDRPVEVRRRDKNRIDRIQHNTLQEALDDDVFALVTYNSVAAIESVFHGIPAFTLAPANAASPVASQDLSQIENPYYPSQDKLYAWGCHLAYGQFHINELKSGKAQRMLEEL